MVPQLVTQLDLDAPLVVVVGQASALRSEVSRAVSGMGLHTIVCSETEIQTTVDEASLGYAYKIIWLVSPLEYFTQHVQNLKNYIEPFSKKVIIVQPIMDGVVTQSDSVFHTTWKKVTELQREIILDINAVFDNSLFIFAKNLFGTPLFPLEICSIHVNKNIMYDPGVQLSLLSIEAFVQRAVPLFFKPAPQHSFCFSGESVHSSQLVEEITQLFGSYYQLDLVIKHEKTEIISSIPFEVSEITIKYISSASITDEFVRSWKDAPSKLNSYIPSIQLRNTQPQIVQKYVEQNFEPFVQADVNDEPDVLPDKNVQIEAEVTAVPPQEKSVAFKETFIVETEETDTVIRASDEGIFITTETETNSTETKKNQENLDINTELSRIFKEPRTAVRVARVESMAHTELKHTGKSKRKKVLFYGGLGFIGVGFGIATLIAVFIGTQFMVKRQLLAVAKTAVQQTVDRQSWSNLQKMASFLEIQAKSYGTIFDLALISDAEHLVAVTSQLSEVSFLLEDMKETSQTMYYRLMGLDEGSVFEVSSDLSSKSETAYENLSLVTAGIDQIPFGEDDTQKTAILTDYQLKIEAMRNGLMTQHQILPLMQDLFGGTKKTYLILFQNEQELRPTGGFIQAAAVVTFSEGRLISSQVFSSYDIDALVSGTVAPPDDLPTYLGEQQWYFRDSNWNPDFTQAAAKASWFMTKAAGGKIDGVIALDLKSTGMMVDALGPLEIAEHNEVVTSKNLDALMEHHSEKLLVKGTTEKAYSVLLLERLLDKIKTAQPEKISGFLTAVHDGLQQNEILISSTDTSVQDLLTTMGWTGSLVKPECPMQFSSEVCTVDTIAQVAANTGVNKANYYLEENIDHTVELLPGVAQHTRTIQIENTADINAWPKGDYRAYYRFYLNSSAQVSDVIVNNKKLSKSELTERIEQGRTMVGFLVMVPIQAQTEIILKYSVPLSGEAGYSYAFFDQKQPGTDIPTTVTIVPFSGLKPAKIAPQAEVTPSGIVFETEHRDSHGFYGVEFR